MNKKPNWADDEAALFEPQEHDLEEAFLSFSHLQPPTTTCDKPEPANAVGNYDGECFERVALVSQALRPSSPLETPARGGDGTRQEHHLTGTGEFTRHMMTQGTQRSSCRLTRRRSPSPQTSPATVQPTQQLPKRRASPLHPPPSADGILKRSAPPTQKSDTCSSLAATVTVVAQPARASPPSNPTASQPRPLADVLIAVLEGAEETFYVTDEDARVPLWCPWRRLEDTPLAIRGWGLPDAVCDAYQALQGSRKSGADEQQEEGGDSAEEDGGSNHAGRLADTPLYPWQRACLFEYFASLQRRENAAYGLRQQAPTKKSPIIQGLMASLQSFRELAGASEAVPPQALPAPPLEPDRDSTRCDLEQACGDATSCNLLYSAPTGGGKTLVAEIIMLRCCLGVNVGTTQSMLATKRGALTVGGGSRGEEGIPILLASDLIIFCEDLCKQWANEGDSSRRSEAAALMAVIARHKCPSAHPLPKLLGNGKGGGDQPAGGEQKKVMFIVPYVALAEEKAEIFSHLVEAYNASLAAGTERQRAHAHEERWLSDVLGLIDDRDEDDDDVESDDAHNDDDDDDDASPPKAAAVDLRAPIVREVWMHCRTLEVRRFMESLVSGTPLMNGTTDDRGGAGGSSQDSLASTEGGGADVVAAAEGDDATSMGGGDRPIHTTRRAVMYAYRDHAAESRSRFATLRLEYDRLVRLLSLFSGRSDADAVHMHHRKDRTHGTTGPSAVMAPMLAATLAKRVQCHAGQKGHRSLSHDIFVCTIEKANVLLNLLVERGRAAELSCVVVDEVHQIREHGRGYVLELLLTKLIALSSSTFTPLPTQQQTDGTAVVAPAAASSSATPVETAVPPTLTLKVVGMSATLSNAPTLCKWMKEALLFVTDFRPVPLLEHFVVQGDVFGNRGALGGAALPAAPSSSSPSPYALVRRLGRQAVGEGAVNDASNALQPQVYVSAWAQQQRLMERDLQVLAAEGAVGGHQVLVFCPSRMMCETSAEAIVNGLGTLVDWAAFLPSNLRPPPIAAPKIVADNGQAPPPPPPRPHKSIARLARARRTLLKELKAIPASPNAAALINVTELLQKNGQTPPMPAANTHTSKDNAAKGSAVGDPLVAPPAPLLVPIVAFGVAFHHAALTGDERRLIERAYRAGVLWCLCCTTTLATGVNLPTRRVIFRSIKVADQMIDAGQYRQAAGRAGRKGLDTLGESYILCRPVERSYVEHQLLAASLPPIVSNFSLEKRGMVRVLLEGIVTGTIRNVFDVQRSIEGTLLSAALQQQQQQQQQGTSGAAAVLPLPPADGSNSKEGGNGGEGGGGGGGEIVFATAKSALQFLELNQFVDWDVDAKVFTATALGEAAVASSMAPDEAILLFKDLAKARRCLCMDHNAEDLQLLFLCTPYFHGVEPNWSKFHSDHYARIPSEVRQNVCGPLLGIDEGQLFQWAMVPPKHGLGGSNSAMYGATRGNNSNTVMGQQQQQLVVGGADLTILAYKRFYVALILWDVIREVPHATICKRFPPLSRAELNRLTDLASAFAAMTSSFTTSLGWWFFPPLFDTMAARLSVGVEPDLIPLMKIEGLSARRARELAKKGYRTPLAIACATPQELEAVLSKRAPFAVNANIQRGGGGGDAMVTVGSPAGAIGQKRPREGGQTAVGDNGTPQRPEVRNLEEDAVIPVNLPGNDVGAAATTTAAPSNGPNALPILANTSTITATSFYQIDTRRLAARIIEAAKEAVQAEAQEVSDAAAEAGITVAVPMLVAKKDPFGGGGGDRTAAAREPPPQHRSPTTAASALLAYSSSVSGSVAWTTVDCSNHVQWMLFATLFQHMMLSGVVRDTCSDHCGCDERIVGVHLVRGGSSSTGGNQRPVTSIVIAVRVEKRARGGRAVTGNAAASDGDAVSSHTHVFNLGHLRLSSSSSSSSSPMKHLKGLMRDHVLMNRCATLALHDAKGELHSWRHIGLLDYDLVPWGNKATNIHAQEHAVAVPRNKSDSRGGGTLAGTMQCRLFDPLIADWLLEPEDRAGGRRMTLDQLCALHNVPCDGGHHHTATHHYDAPRMGGGGEAMMNTAVSPAVSSVSAGTPQHLNASAVSSASMAMAAGRGQGEDPTSTYRRMAIPAAGKTTTKQDDDGASGKGALSETLMNFVVSALAPFSDTSTAGGDGRDESPIPPPIAAAVEAIAAHAAALLRPPAPVDGTAQQQHHNNTSMALLLDASSAAVAKAVDKRAQRQAALLQRQRCAYGVKLCNATKVLTLKMRQYDANGSNGGGAAAARRGRSEESASSDSSHDDEPSSENDDTNNAVVGDCDQHKKVGSAHRRTIPIASTLIEYYYTVEMKMVLVLVSMESSGIGFDPNRYEWLLGKMRARSSELVAEAYAVTGHSNWELSNVQACAKMLFDVMGMPCLERTFDAKYLPKRLLKSAARGKGRGARVANESRSTKASVLNGLVKLFPEARLPLIIKEFRTMEGWTEKYLRPLLWCWQVQQERSVGASGGLERDRGLMKQNKIGHCARRDDEHEDEDDNDDALPHECEVAAEMTAPSTPLLSIGRVHGEFLQTATATGRLSMNDPNLQTIPHPIVFTMDSGEAVDVKLRQAYVAPKMKGSHGGCPIDVPMVAAEDGDNTVTGQTPHPLVVGGGGGDDPFVLVSADYAQIEARLLAHFSRDPKLIEAFRANDDHNEGNRNNVTSAHMTNQTAKKTVASLDVFERLALQIFYPHHQQRQEKENEQKQPKDGGRKHNVSTAAAAPPPRQLQPVTISAEQRKAAKTLCYGMIYGKGAAAIADDVEMSLDDATALLNDFKRTYAVATAFIERLGNETGRKGFVATILGRRRWLPYAGSRNPRHKAASDRIAINTLCQGSAADIIKIAMVGLLGGIEEETVTDTCGDGERGAALSQAPLIQGEGTAARNEHVITPPTAWPQWTLSSAIRYLFIGAGPSSPPRARLLLQIHDELVFEVRQSDLQLLAHTVTAVMDVSDALRLRVPLPVRVKAGPNWADMVPVTLDDSVRFT